MSNRREFLIELAGATAGALFVNCGLVSAASRLQQSGGMTRRREVAAGGKRVKTIDVHCHLYVLDIWDLIKDNEQAQGAKRYLENQALNPANLDSRLKTMDEWGIDVQAVSIAPEYNYWAGPDLARRIVQIENEKIAAVCATHPDRFVGLGALALQHPDLAVEQMEEGIKKLGLRGFEIGGSVNGEELSAPKFQPFWAKAEETGTLIFIHPALLNDAARRFQGKGRLDNVIGNPLETTLALSHLIFEGTLDRFPGLKICAAHGGGFLPSYSGRADRCYGDPQSCKTGPKRPSEYLQQLYYDSLVFTNEGMRHLIAEVGASQILLGTDFPFGWETHVVDYLLGVPGLSADQQKAILGGNAAKLLRIDT